MKIADANEIEPTIYWGVECRTCSERIILGIRLHQRFGDISAFLKPGTIQCVHGHKHNYYRDDLVFVEQNQPVTEAGIEKNRSRFHRIERLIPNNA